MALNDHPVDCFCVECLGTDADKPADEKDE